MTMVGNTTVSNAARRVHWSGILAGAVMAVMVQLLLTLLGIGIGVLSFDRGSDAATTTWVAFAWWGVSGIIAAFVGGWFAGKANAGEANGTMQGLGAWAVSALLVIGGASVAATGTAGVLSNVAGPVMATIMNSDQQPQSPQTTGAGANMGGPQAQSAKEHLGSVMLSTFVVLIIGGFAGALGGRIGAAGTDRLQHLT